jgi:beta-1,4-mannooligosaccharide/beta-1,4-mannosyl-N-acetylglucosamine phosphorylase
MTQYKVIGEPLPNIPWEERGSDCDSVIWRSRSNPIIPRDLIPSSNSIFNNAVVPYQGAFAGVFRCDDKARRMVLHAGRSEDGVSWSIHHEMIEFAPEPTDTRVQDVSYFEYGYDPRVIWLEDRYYVTWCNCFHGPTIGVGYTRDFETFYQLENAYLPFDRNGALFPRKVNGNYAMLSRPSDNGHTPFGDFCIARARTCATGAGIGT